MKKMMHKSAVSRLNEAAESWRPLESRLARSPNGRVLLVDDDAEMAPIVQTALESYDLALDSVLDGPAALAALETNTYGVVILDLGMAGMSGFEVLRAIRRQLTLHRVPVLVLTADTSEEALARSFGFGADDFVAKPVKGRELGIRTYRLLCPMPAPFEPGAKNAS